MENAVKDNIDNTCSSPTTSFPRPLQLLLLLLLLMLLWLIHVCVFVCG